MADNEYYLNLCIEELEISVRSYHSLKKAGMIIVAEIARKTKKELLGIPGIARISANEIEELILKMGLDLGMEISDDQIAFYLKQRKKEEEDQEIRHVVWEYLRNVVPEVFMGKRLPPHLARRAVEMVNQKLGIIIPWDTEP